MGQTNYSVGHEAEQRAAQYLEKLGYKIQAINWKSRVCEIDIIAEKNKVIHFVEVKYRKTNNQGKGLEYITPKKLKQMQFAATIWVQQSHWTGEYELSAIEMTGEYFTVLNFITSIT